MQEVEMNGLVIREDRDHGNLIFTKDAEGNYYAGDNNGNIVFSYKKGEGVRVFINLIDDANNMGRMPEGEKLFSPELLCMMVRNMLLSEYISSMKDVDEIKVNVYGKKDHVSCFMFIKNMNIILEYGPFKPIDIPLSDTGYIISTCDIDKSLRDWYGIDNLPETLKPYEYDNQ